MKVNNVFLTELEYQTVLSKYPWITEINLTFLDQPNTIFCWIAIGDFLMSAIIQEVQEYSFQSTGAELNMSKFLELNLKESDVGDFINELHNLIKISSDEYDRLLKINGSHKYIQSLTIPNVNI